MISGIVSLLLLTSWLFKIIIRVFRYAIKLLHVELEYIYILSESKHLFLHDVDFINDEMTYTSVANVEH